MRFVRAMCLILLCGLLAGCGNESRAAETVPGEYENYYILNGDYVQVLEASSAGVSQAQEMQVSLVSTEGPTSLDVQVSWKTSGASDWTGTAAGCASLAGDACSFVIPENCAFKVEARAAAGKNGYATLHVVLS